MKKLFSRENFVFSSLEQKARRQSLIVSCAVICLFIISALTFMNMLYGFVDAIGSIVSGSLDVAIYDTLRSVPLYLTFFMSLWSLLLAHAYYRNADPDRRNRSIKKNTIAIACFAFVNIIYILVGRMVGKYLSLVEGGPSPIYPLDALLYSVFFLLLAIGAFIYLPKLETKHPYIVPSRGPIVTKARFVYCFFISIWMLFTLFTFGGFTIGLFIIDFRHGYQAFSIALLLVFLVNICFFSIWEFYYNELKEEKRKEILLPLSLIGLCIAICSMVFYFVALSFNLDGPSKVGYGVLPVAFAASVNIATLLVVALPLIVSIVALIKGIKIRNK